MNINKTDVKPIQNVLWNWGGFLFTAIVAFFLGPYILAKLGSTSYGIWVLLGSLVGYLGLLDLGVRSAVTKFIASYYSAGNHTSASDLKSAALLVFSVAGLLAIIITVGISPFVEQLFTIPPESKVTAQIAFIICGINIAVALITGVYGGVLTGRQRFDLLNITNIITISIRTIAIVTALEFNQGILITQKTDQGIIILAIIQLSSSVIQLILLQQLSRIIYREAVSSIQRALSVESVKKLLTFGLFSSIIQILAAIAHNSAFILIGSLLPVAMVTYYSIAWNLTEYGRTLMSGVSFTIPPLVGAMEGANQLNQVGRVFIDGARYTSLIILPIVATFMVRGESFISLWMGAEYGSLSGQILFLLSLALWAMAGYQICTTVMIGLGKHNGMVPIFAFEAIVNIVLSIILIKKFGVIGSAWGALIPRLFVSFIMCIIYAKKVLLISITEYYLDAIIRPIIAMLPFFIASYIIEKMWPAQNLVVFFLQIAFAIPIAMIGSWIFGLKPNEKIKYANTIKNKYGKTIKRRIIEIEID